MKSEITLRDIRYFEHILSALENDNIPQDLHIHTSLSDGYFSLEDTVKKIVAKRIKMFCITDHNSLVQYTNSILDSISDDKTIFCYGTELSCSYNDTRVHVLGYFLNNDNNNTRELIEKIFYGHWKREELRIERMRAIDNASVTINHLKSITNDVPNWKSVAEALVLAGDAQSIDEASNRFMQKGKSGYISYKDNWPKVSATDAVKAILSDGGIPVLAHLGDLENKLGRDETQLLVKKLSEIGLWGFDTSHNGNHEAISESLRDFCIGQDSIGLYPVIGSDSHNADFNNIQCDSCVRFIYTLLCRYAEKYLSNYLHYSIYDMLQPCFIPDFDFDFFPKGYLDNLSHNNTIRTFEDLISASNYDAVDIHLIKLSAVIVISALCFRWAEDELYSIIDDSKANEEQERYIVNLLSSKIKYFKHNVVNMCADDKKTCLRKWIPIFYRLNYYNDANYLLNKLLKDSSFIPFNKFKEYTQSNEIALKDKLSSYQVVFNEIVDYLKTVLSGAMVIIRPFKTYASLYCKYVKCNLVLRNKKMPSVESNNFFSIFEDLFAVTILLKEKVLEQEILDILSMKDTLTVHFIDSERRRWYHSRVIILLEYYGLVSEILMKTHHEYWFAYYYYWKTKNYFVFDKVNEELELKIDSAVNEEEMISVAVKHLMTMRRSDVEHG